MVGLKNWSDEERKHYKPNGWVIHGVSWAYTQLFFFFGLRNITHNLIPLIWKNGSGPTRTRVSTFNSTMVKINNGKNGQAPIHHHERPNVYFGQQMNPLGNNPHNFFPSQVESPTVPIGMEINSLILLYEPGLWKITRETYRKPYSESEQPLCPAKNP